MPYPCPECGSPVSERAAVCPQCGFPIRRDALAGAGGQPGAPASSGGKLAVVLLAVVVGGFFVVVMIGVVAAIAIPRLSQAARQAKQREGEFLLKQGYELEQAYRSENGRYTPRVDDLRWGAKPVPRYYELRVSAADDRTLCLEAVPTPAAAGQVPTLSMDAEGNAYREAGCGGAVALAGDGGSGDAPVPAGEAASSPDGSEPGLDGGAARGSQGEANARELLSQVYAATVAYRARHGRAPRDVADVLEQARDFRPGTQYQLDSGTRGGEICFVARPRGGGTSLATYSLDAQGRMFQGPGCTGTLVGRFSAGRS